MRRSIGGLIVLIVCILVTGCSTESKAEKERRVKQQLAEMAQAYLSEKYGIDEAKLVEVKLSYGGYNGPIPVFKREVPESGVVTLEYNDTSIRVLAGPTLNRFTDEYKNVLSDDYEAEQIKADIKEKLIDKYKVTDEYYVHNYQISSLQDSGGFDYFTLEQKYEGDLQAFLENHHLGLELEIFFQGNEVGKDQYFDQAKELFHQLASHFSNAEGNISIYVSREDRYMDEQMKHIVDPQNPRAIDAIIYGPKYNYCKVTGEIHNKDYVERIKKEYPQSDMMPLEVKENAFHYVEVDEGISVASTLENVDFYSTEDVVYSFRPLTEGDLFAGADYAALDPDEDDQYEYGLLNEAVYRLNYAKKEYNGEEVEWSDRIAVTINRNEVPERVDQLFLVHRIDTDDNEDKLLVELSEPYSLVSGDVYIAQARPDCEFAIVYRVTK